MFGTVLGDMRFKRSPGSNRKSRVLYPSPRFLSSASWPIMPKKNSIKLINQSNLISVKVNL